jgi:hypothetical protein
MRGRGGHSFAHLPAAARRRALGRGVQRLDRAGGEDGPSPVRDRLRGALRPASSAIGELLSLPLFALLVALAGRDLSLELAGGCWLAAYIAYGAFNFWAARR